MITYTLTKFRLLYTVILFLIGMAFAASLTGLFAFKNSVNTISGESRIHVAGRYLLHGPALERTRETDINRTLL